MADCYYSKLLAETLAIRSATRNMLLRVHNWDVFSNHFESADGDVFGPGNSLEGIHDSIHDLVGGGGHMSSVPHAGKSFQHQLIARLR